MPLADITRSFQAGVGDTLGFVAMVIGLGTVIGKLLAESGGSAVVSSALIRAMGERRLDWAMMLSGFVIGLPVFFQVGLVLLAPVLFTLVQQTGAPLLGLGLPLVAGLSTAHGLVPPHPGPVAAIANCTPTGTHAPLLADRRLPHRGDRRAALRPLHLPEDRRGAWRDRGAAGGERASGATPSLGITLLTILMPVLLMLAAALAQAVLEPGAVRRRSNSRARR